MKPGELAATITILVFVVVGLTAIAYTKWSKYRVAEKSQGTEEEGRASTPRSSPRNIEVSHPMPRFKTRSSLSMSSNPSSPQTPNTPWSPGIRFSITPPSYRSRRSGSIESLPNVETVLEKYEQEADAVEKLGSSTGQRISTDEILGEPGPSTAEANSPDTEKSAWDKPHIAARLECEL